MLKATYLHQLIVGAESVFISPGEGICRVTLRDGTVRDITAAEIAGAEAVLAAAEQAKSVQAKRDQVIKQAMNAFADSVISDKDITPTAALEAMKDAAAAKAIDVAVVAEEAAKP